MIGLRVRIICLSTKSEHNFWTCNARLGDWYRLLPTSETPMKFWKWLVGHHHHYPKSLALAPFLILENFATINFWFCWKLMFHRSKWSDLQFEVQSSTSFPLHHRSPSKITISRSLFRSVHVKALMFLKIFSWDQRTLFFPVTYVVAVLRKLRGHLTFPVGNLCGSALHKSLKGH